MAIEAEQSLSLRLLSAIAHDRDSLERRGKGPREGLQDLIETLIADSVRVSPTERIHQPFPEELSHLQGRIKQYRNHFPDPHPGKILTKPTAEKELIVHTDVVFCILGPTTGLLSMLLFGLGLSSGFTVIGAIIFFIVGLVCCGIIDKPSIRQTLQDLEHGRKSRLEAGHAWLRENEDHTQYSVTVTGFQDQVSIKLQQHRPKQSGYSQKVVAERIFRGDETVLAASCKALFERRAARYEAESQAKSLTISQRLEEAALDYQLKLQTAEEAEEQACQLVRALGGTMIRTSI
jgi:hypothetical protein